MISDKDGEREDMGTLRIAQIARKGITAWSLLANGSRTAWIAFLGSRFAKLSFSQFGEDMILKAIFARYGNTYQGFYVDVGAHHPKRFSNTYSLYIKGWRGLCIDPIPEGAKKFARCRPQDIFLEVGVSERKIEMIYYMFDEPGLNTFSLEQATRSISHKFVQAKKVKTSPLRNILDEWLPRGQVIDFLSVDTEGMELEVISSNDWQRYRPRVVLLEAMSIRSYSDIARLEIDIFMNRNGYKAISWVPSGLFYVDTTSTSYDGGAYLNFQ